MYEKGCVETAILLRCFTYLSLMSFKEPRLVREVLIYVLFYGKLKLKLLADFAILTRHYLCTSSTVCRVRICSVLQKLYIKAIRVFQAIT
jgi:hypothetical protein